MCPGRMIPEADTKGLSGNSVAGGSALERLKASGKSAMSRQREEEATQRADGSVRRRLSVLKTLSPLALAIVRRPGFEADDGELLAAIRLLRDETENSARELVSVLGGEAQQPWLIRAVSSTVAELVAAEWISGADRLDMSPYQPIWGYLADADFVSDEDLPELPNEDHSVMLRLSLLKAMSSVVASTRRCGYLMRHDADALYKTISESIYKVAQANLPKIVPPESSAATQVTALQSLIGRAGEIFTVHWEAYVEAALQRLDAMTKAERVELYKKYPDGLPIEPVFVSFAKDMSRTVSGVLQTEPGIAKVAALES